LKPLEVKAFGVGGGIETFEPFYYTIAVGDEYEMTEGCRKRLEDCKAKNNVIHFGGFSFVPTQSIYQQFGSKQ
jgi:hypothetical protein